MGGDLLGSDGRCDQACFSASPLAPMGVTILRSVCERDRYHSGRAGSFYDSASKVQVANSRG